MGTSDLGIVVGIGKRNRNAPNDLRSKDSRRAMMEELGLEFVLSARTVGKFGGSIYVIDFNILPHIKQQLSRLNVIFLEPIQPWYSNCVSVERYLQLLHYIENGTIGENYISVHDSDVWWQGSVSEIPAICPPSGISFATAARKTQNTVDGWALQKEFDKRFERFKNECGYCINIGFMAGTKSNMHRKLVEFRKFVERDDVPDFFALDQVAYMWIHDYANDVINGDQFNAITTQQFNVNTPIVTRDGIVANAVHLAGGRKSIPEHWFRNRYPDIYKDFVNE